MAFSLFLLVLEAAFAFPLALGYDHRALGENYLALALGADHLGADHLGADHFGFLNGDTHFSGLSLEGEPEFYFGYFWSEFYFGYFFIVVLAVFVLDLALVLDLAFKTPELD